MHLSYKILIGMVLGVVAGLVAGPGSAPLLKVWVTPVGTLFINLIKMIIVPVVLASLVVGAAALGDVKKLGRVGAKIMTFYLLTTAFAVSFGLFLGAMLTFVFSALTMSAVQVAAQNIVVEVRRQFHEIAGIMEGKAKPDYAACVGLCTEGAPPHFSPSSSRSQPASSSAQRVLSVCSAASPSPASQWQSSCPTPAAPGTTRRSTSKRATTAARAASATRQPLSATPSAIRSRIRRARPSTSSSSSARPFPSFSAVLSLRSIFSKRTSVPVSHKRREPFLSANSPRPKAGGCLRDAFISARSGRGRR